MSSYLHCISGKLVTYCGKKKKKNVVCEMFCKQWIGDDTQKIFYMCHKLQCHETLFVTVINQKSALVIWGMKEILCSMY